MYMYNIYIYILSDAFNPHSSSNSPISSNETTIESPSCSHLSSLQDGAEHSEFHRECFMGNSGDFLDVFHGCWMGTSWVFDGGWKVNETMNHSRDEWIVAISINFSGSSFWKGGLALDFYCPCPPFRMKTFQNQRNVLDLSMREEHANELRRKLTGSPHTDR